MARGSCIKGLYVVLDFELVNGDVAGAAKDALSAGCKIIQLRAKETSSSTMLAAARTLSVLAREYDAVFIVNDRADIAMLSGADGLHVGQEDIPPEEARRVVGDKMIIGFSTHTAKEAKAGAALVKKGVVDYVSFGPVFGTATKKDARPKTGLSLLKEAVNIVSSPVVAIGGINDENIKDVFDAGAASAAVISAVLSAKDRQVAAKKLVDAAVKR